MIYFLHSDRFIKIRFSISDFGTFSNTYNPHKMTLLGAIDGDRARETELHHQFDHLRVERRRGRRPEWFHCDYELVLFIADLIDAEGKRSKQPTSAELPGFANTWLSRFSGPSQQWLMVNFGASGRKLMFGFAEP